MRRHIPMTHTLAKFILGWNFFGVVTLLGWYFEGVEILSDQNFI